MSSKLCLYQDTALAALETSAQSTGICTHIYVYAHMHTHTLAMPSPRSPRWPCWSQEGQAPAGTVARYGPVTLDCCAVKAQHAAVHRAASPWNFSSLSEAECSLQCPTSQGAKEGPWLERYIRPSRKIIHAF